MENVSEAPAPNYISNPVKLVRPAYEALKVNLRISLTATILVIAAMLVIVVMLGGMLAAGSHAVNSASVVGIFIAVAVLLGLIAAFVSPFFFRFLLESVRGRKLSLRELFRMDRTTYWRVLGTSILSGLTIILGFILLIVPGIIFVGWFTLANFAALDESLAPVAAMKRSRQLVRGHLTEIYAMLLLPSAISIIGFVPVLGALASVAFSIVYGFAPALRYNQLKSLKASGQEVPMDKWNIVIIVLGLIIGSVFQTATYNRNIQQQPQPGTTTYTLNRQ